MRAEQEYVGAPTGGLDQAISVYAEPEHALLLDFATGAREQVPFDPAAHGLALLVVDTKVSHELTDGGYGSRRDAAWEAAERSGVEHLAQAGSDDLDGLPEPLLRRARHVVSEVARVDAFVEALRADDWDAIGPLMVASHVSLRDDYEVSCEELDVAVDVARETGAIGARMTGGGFGGSAIALVPVERVDAVQTAVSTAFVARGWGEPTFIVRAGPRARVAPPPWAPVAHVLGRSDADASLAEGVDEQRVVLAHRLGVRRPKSTTWSVNARRRPFSDVDDRLLHLEVDEVLVAVLVAGAVHLGGGPAEQVDHGGHVVGLGDVLPVEVHLVRRHLGHHVATPSISAYPSSGSVCTCSARWLTTVRWPSCSK